MNQRGIVNPLAIPFILALLLMFGLAVTTLLYYTKYSEQRDDTDALIASAVEKSDAETEVRLRAEYDEELKSPFDTYTSPSALSTVQVTYPRTWSAYVIEKSSGSLVIDGYFHPKTVPDTKSDINFALRVTLENKPYSDSVGGYQRSVDGGELKANAITVNGVKGVRFDGTISRDVSGALVVLPVRDKTLKVWSESSTYLKDFTDIIVKQLTFDP